MIYIKKLPNYNVLILMKYLGSISPDELWLWHHYCKALCQKGCSNHVEPASQKIGVPALMFSSLASYSAKIVFSRFGAAISTGSSKLFYKFKLLKAACSWAPGLISSGSPCKVHTWYIYMVQDPQIKYWSKLFWYRYFLDICAALDKPRSISFCVSNLCWKVEKKPQPPVKFVQFYTILLELRNHVEVFRICS